MMYVTVMSSGLLQLELGDHKLKILSSQGGGEEFERPRFLPGREGLMKD